MTFQERKAIRIRTMRAWENGMIANGEVPEFMISTGPDCLAGKQISVHVSHEDCLPELIGLLEVALAKAWEKHGVRPTTAWPPLLEAIT
jgi:hypothetical protein